MPITTLIDKLDASELVRDKIAHILLTESASQQALAAAQVPPKDPNLWKLRVFLERAHPWAEYFDRPDTDESPGFAPPIVNVSLDSVAYEKSASNSVERQRGTGTYHIDVYGYGVAREAEGGGHVPGDQAAAIEAQRCVRLVRNILMAGTYTYLDFPRGANQVVTGRWPAGIQYFQPQLDSRTVQQVVGGRLTLEVSFNELSPQVEGVPLEWINTIVKRPSGEVSLNLAYDVGEPGDGAPEP